MKKDDSLATPTPPTPPSPPTPLPLLLVSVSLSSDRTPCSLACHLHSAQTAGTRSSPTTYSRIRNKLFLGWWMDRLELRLTKPASRVGALVWLSLATLEV